MGITELTACRADAGLFGELVLVVDVYFVELDGSGRGVLRNFFKDGANGPARAAPGSPEINDYGFISADLMLGHEGTSSRWNGGGDVRCV